MFVKTFILIIPRIESWLNVNLNALNVMWKDIKIYEQTFNVKKWDSEHAKRKKIRNFKGIVSQNSL